MKKLSISIILFICITSARGQQAFTNAGDLRIHAGASVTSFGNFINNGTGLLMNNGNFYVKGNISNAQASMPAGTGTLYLNGGSAQAIDGTMLFRVNNLVTSNGAGITLNNNLSIAGVHTFTNGLIGTSAAPNYLIYEAGSSYSGSNDNSHVIGWVKKTGSTDFLFPVGDGSYLRPVGLTNLSVSAEFNCHYYTPAFNLSNLQIPVRMVKQNEYWQINKVTGGTAQVILNWDHSKVIMNNVLLADIVASNYSAGNWITAGGVASGNVLTTGTVTSSGTAAFGSFTFGYKSYPVPLTLISFTAERRPGVTDLHWITDNEEKVSHFDIQRSYDASSFTSIGITPARNRSTQENYYFNDQSALMGFAWYRLRSVDLDGRFSYSKIAVVYESATDPGSFVVVNPVHRSISVINKTGKEGVFQYSVNNSAGQVIIKGTTSMTARGGAVFTLPSSIAGGIYVLSISNEITHFRQRILVDK